jgi:hypothetical protein
MATRKNRADLTTQSDEIKNEATALANTKTRVAAMVENTNESNVNWLDDVVLTTAGNLDTKVPTAKAVNDAIATAVTGLWDDRGNFDASVNAYPSSGGSGTAGAILKGDIYTVSVPGVLPTGQVVKIRDTVRALVDTPGNTQSNWAINSIDKVEKDSTSPTAPTTAFDSSMGYGLYYTVQDTSTGLTYICRDASVGAAVWHLFGTYDFSLALSASDLATGPRFDIPQLVELPAGYMWNIINVVVDYIYGTEDYDSLALSVETLGADTIAFDDAGIIGGAHSSMTFLMQPYYNSTMKATGKVRVNVDGSPTTGDGTVKIYGLAQLIKLFP